MRLASRLNRDQRQAIVPTAPRTSLLERMRQKSAVEVKLDAPPAVAVQEEYRHPNEGRWADTVHLICTLDKHPDQREALYDWYNRRWGV